MAGTKAGGKAAAATNKQKYGEDFYGRIGAIGGTKSGSGGFATKAYCDGRCKLNKILGSPHRTAQCAGYKGGVTRRRSK